MKAEKILSLIEKAINHDGTRAEFDGICRWCNWYNKDGIDSEIFGDFGERFALAVLYTEAQKEYNNETAKAAGKLQTKRAAEKILKDTPKYWNAGAIPTSGGRYIFSDSYYGMRITEKFDFPEWKNAPDINRFFEQAKQNDGERLTPPTVSELKNYIREQKAARPKGSREKINYDFGDGAPMVNADYLLTLLQGLGDVTITAAEKNAETSALYLQSNIGDAILLPIRKG